MVSERGVVNTVSTRYNDLGVITMAIAREHVKALIDRLSDEQVQALWVILNSMAWPTEKVSPEEAAEIEESFAEIDAGKGVKAEDVWRELGV
ncbi:hypothetical protein GFC01_10970 [Desulfofundulus thermobenzoicus]|uniref:Uncharacterized protein n=2 Tax=Desulfofundulus thermobenzoicus TaxID=29376 RepID=A0A6N7IRT2_9FIRM|nr:hypothetical protein [Desulfofundulus thermobenzoicus]